MNSPPIIQVVGYSKSGKTSLITKLIELLNEKEINVFVIKSARSHAYEFSSKDSDRFLESGAQSSAVIFKEYTQTSLKGATDVVSLVEIMNELNHFEIVILEGFKDLSYPKVLMYADEIPSSDEIDFSTIRYLYSSTEQIKHKSLKHLIKTNKIALIKSAKELASRIILDLEKR